MTEAVNHPPAELSSGLRDGEQLDWMETENLDSDGYRVHWSLNAPGIEVIDYGRASTREEAVNAVQVALREWRNGRRLQTSAEAMESFEKWL